MNMAGLDLSAWQHVSNEVIDWDKVRDEGYRFAWIKFTQGTSYLNPYAAEDAIEAHHAGLLVGAYTFGVPGDGTGEEQAMYLHQHAKNLPLALGYALDFEELGDLPDVTAGGPWAQAFLETWKALGIERTFYTLPSWLPSLYGYPWGARLWLPNIDLPEGRPVLYLQGLEAGDIPGIGDPCDADTCTNVRGLNPVTPLPPGPNVATPAAAEPARWVPGPPYPGPAAPTPSSTEPTPSPGTSSSPPTA